VQLKPKRPRGRPSKNGSKDPKHLGRALTAYVAYHEARRAGEKHYSALIEAADFIRKTHPHTPMSETEAKRVLAEFRPKDSPLELRVERSTLEGEEAAERRRYWLERIAPVENVPTKSEDNLRKRLTVFTIGFGPRTVYPRHNCKNPKR
jgi:hypothetical protein